MDIYIDLIHHVTAIEFDSPWNSYQFQVLNSIELNVITGFPIEFYIITWNSIEFSVYIVFIEVEVTLD
jgi:hypothetical protein